MNTPLPGWPHESSPFHAVELALQERYGRRENLDQGARRGVRTVLIDQHRSFFAQLPFLLVGSVDKEGQPWASMLAGSPGFVHSPVPERLRVDTRPFAGDPLGQNLGDSGPIGILGIELPTRRRNRMNGIVAENDKAGFSVSVVQSYGNCPQYIQERELRWVTDVGDPPQILRSDHLSESDRALLERADTFFIASVNPQQNDGPASGADVSHRGGRPGFIRVDDDHTITTPDFVGNYFFNTIGNLLIEPRAGLLFVDFETGDLLLAAAEAEIVWQGPEVNAFAGAQRLVRFHLRTLIRLAAALPFRLEGTIAYAREIERTGTWPEAELAIAASSEDQRWRPFRVAGCVDETPDVRSFLLVPADNGGLAAYRPGQFLPVRLSLGQREPVVRTYTLSDTSDGRSYRISVKRNGLASAWLHNNAKPGTIIETLAPRGTFVFDDASLRPVALISAGIGITPMIAMLNSLLVNDMRTRRAGQILFIHGARNGAEHPFAEHVRHKAKHHGNLSIHIAYSKPAPDELIGATHDSTGRIDPSVLHTLLPSPDIDAYLCGPSAFMQEQYNALRAFGVPDGQIHFEAFGPASVRRTHMPDNEATGTTEGPTVAFARSGTSTRWRSNFTSLLDSAEAAGLSPLYSCRSGVCGTCTARLIAGQVHYPQEPVAERAPGEVLLCCAQPGTEGGEPTAVVLDI